MLISFPMRARLRIIEILRTKIKDQPIDNTDVIQGYDVLVKIKISAAEWERLKTKLPDGGWQVEDSTIQNAPKITRDLDGTLAKFLHTFLKNANCFGVDDREWWPELAAQLTAEQPAAKKTASIR